MTPLNIIQEPKVGSFVVVRTNNSSFTKYGTITEFNDNWIYLESYKSGRSGWIKRSILVDCYNPSSIPGYIR